MTSNLVERMACRSVLAVIRVSSAMGQASSWPAARFRHSGVYDEGRKEFEIYGGYTWNPTAQRVESASDIWAWNSSTWKLISDTGVHRYVASMAFDSKRQRALIFDGADDSGTTDGKLSSLEGGTWKLVRDLPSLKRADASLAYDSKRDRLVLFGGSNAVMKRFSSLIPGNSMAATGSPRLWLGHLCVRQERLCTIQSGA
jgi:hypothetical protein